MLTVPVNPLRKILVQCVAVVIGVIGFAILIAQTSLWTAGGVLAFIPNTILRMFPRKIKERTA